MTHTRNFYTAAHELESWKKAGKLENAGGGISGSGAAAESWKLRGELEPHVTVAGELHHALASWKFI